MYIAGWTEAVVVAVVGAGYLIILPRSLNCRAGRSTRTDEPLHCESRRAPHELPFRKTSTKLNDPLLRDPRNHALTRPHVRPHGAMRAGHARNSTRPQVWARAIKKKKPPRSRAGVAQWLGDDSLTPVVSRGRGFQIVCISTHGTLIIKTNVIGSVHSSGSS